ncbi:MAG TPA: adenylate/guanylate cyclase domain-containing protein [Anaerolineae bacterium]|nr:adenylate/guanylate cyclase domain-containing protein [Anaerolineae bacterium]
MTDARDKSTQTDLEKLRQLHLELGELISQQNRAIASGLLNELAQSYNATLRVLTQANLCLESLSRGVRTQDKERRQLRAMQEVGAAINSSLDQMEVLNSVMDTIIQLTGAERSFLMLSDERTGELNVKVARNINRETIAESSFDISRSIVRTVSETGEPVVTTNAQADPRFAGQESIITHNLRSILCVPLCIKDHTIGVIYADNRVVSGIFVDADRDLLTAFANQAAVAIENARLFQRIREQLADITELKNLQDDVFESIASGVITIDLDDRISLYNRAAENILGVPGREVLEQDYRLLLNAPMGSVVETLIEKIQAQGGNYHLELDANVGEATQSTLDVTFSPLRDIQQQTLGVALVLDDVSERKRLESVRRYLPPALVDRVRDVDQAQQPQRREISVVFADVRGFTTVSEKWEPEFLIEILNDHLTVAAAAIQLQEGLIDKYDGDTIMALYNSPLNPQENHAERAVRSALAICHDLEAFHETIPAEHRLHFGIGLHTGFAVVGNVGSPLRKDYSAIGDAVNVTDRLQNLAEGGQIILSDSTYQAVSDLIKVTRLDSVQVKGRRQPVQIYLLDGLG